MGKNTAYVFFNGVMNVHSPFYAKLLKNKKNIFCADGGLKYALELGIIPEEIWGDFDSLDNALVDRAESLGSKLVEFNKRKDFTDGELILSELSKRNYDKIIVLGGLGGRTDHLLTNLNLLFKFNNVFYIDEHETIFKVDYKTEIKNKTGKTISFIPLSDTVEEITLTGFEYPLNKYTVHRGESICTSNIIRSKNAIVEFKSGKLLAIIENI